MVQPDQMNSNSDTALDQAAQNLLRSLQALSARDSDDESDDGRHSGKSKKGIRRSGSFTNMADAAGIGVTATRSVPRASPSATIPQVPIKTLGRRRVPHGGSPQELPALASGTWQMEARSTQGFAKQSSTSSLARVSSSGSLGSSAKVHSSSAVGAGIDVASTPAARHPSPSLRVAARNILQDSSFYGKCAMREQTAKLRHSPALLPTLSSADSRNDLPVQDSHGGRIESSARDPCDEPHCTAERPQSMSNEELSRVREELMGLKNAHSETLEELARARKELQKAQEAASDALWVENEPSAELEWVRPEESAFNLYADRQDTWLMITC